MSFKAKNLTVNSAEPAFLKRLRGEVGGEGERHTNPIARPKKAHLKDDEDDDAPTYVDAETNDTLSKDEFEKLQGGEQSKDEQGNSGVSTGGNGGTDKEADDAKSASKKEQIAQIGGASKRRVAKVIGEGGEVENDKAEEKPKKRKKAEGKKNKIKLSFDDD